MPTTKHNVGARLKLPVLQVVEVRGKKSYVIRYEGTLCRVPLFDWQYGLDMPKEILCRLKSINDFGFPEFEQVAQQSEVSLVEKTNSTTSSKKKATVDKVIVSAQKEENPSLSKSEGCTTKSESKDIIVPKLDQPQDIGSCHNITYYVWSGQDTEFKNWFIKTGGLKRRIAILLSLGESIASYHRLNKVYKDFAPEYINVEVVSENDVKVTLPETNYIYSGLGNVFIYASHSAPEVVNRRMPNTPMSDCYSFAILAHELLAFCHPFLGDIINQGNVNADEAYKGNLPWIDNPNDNRNRLLRRLYDCCYTTNEIRKLFRKTFEAGKESPLERPSIFDWIDALQDANSHQKTCPNCKSDYLFYEDDICPICDYEPEFPVAIDIAHLDHKWDNEQMCFLDEMAIYEEPIGTFLVNQDSPLSISSQHLLADSINIKEILRLYVIGTDDKGNVTITLNPLNGYTFYASTSFLEKFAKKIEKQTKVVFPRNNERTLVLSLNNIEEAQRVIIIKLNKLQ